MTTKIKLTVVEVILVVVMAMGLLTAVQGQTTSVMADYMVPGLNGGSCASECTTG